MKIPGPPRAWALFASALLLASCAQSPKLERPVQAREPSGEELFIRYCASCHGDNARGNGPVSPLLTVAVPDLTLIAARREGRFPDSEIFSFVDGQRTVPPYTPRHMPVWGYEFFGDDADDEVAHRQATDKVKRIVAYLRSVQRK